MKTIVKTIDNFCATFNFNEKSEYIHYKVEKDNTTFISFNCSLSYYTNQDINIVTIDDVVDYEINNIKNNLDAQSAINEIKAKHPSIDIKKIVDMNASNLFEFVADNKTDDSSVRFRFAKYLFEDLKVKEFFINASDYAIIEKIKINDIFDKWEVWHWDFLIYDNNPRHKDCQTWAIRNSYWKYEEAPFLTEKADNALRLSSCNDVQSFSKAYTFNYALDRMIDTYQYLFDELKNERYGNHYKTIKAVWDMLDCNQQDKGLCNFIEENATRYSECEDCHIDLKNIFIDCNECFSPSIAYNEYDKKTLETFRSELLDYLENQLSIIKKMTSF